MPLFVGLLVRFPHFDVETQRDTERVCQRLGQVFELVGDDDLDCQVTVPVKRHAIRYVGYELGAVELAGGSFVACDCLLLARPFR